MRDQTDIAELLAYNPEQMTASEIRHICQTVLGHAYSIEDYKKLHQTVQWLNDTLDEFQLSDWKYPLSDEKREGLL